MRDTFFRDVTENGHFFVVAKQRVSLILDLLNENLSECTLQFALIEEELRFIYAPSSINQEERTADRWRRNVGGLSSLTMVALLELDFFE